MSKKISWMFVAISLFAVLAGPSVYAQSSIAVKTDVPFEFRVGGQSLPAGEYTVVTKSPTMVVIRSKDGQRSAVSMTNVVQANQISVDGKLVFNRYGEFYFLSQVWTPGEEVGRKLIRSSTEQEVAAGTARTEKTILIAAQAKK
jgi:hypothetical protein